MTSPSQSRRAEAYSESQVPAREMRQSQIVTSMMKGSHVLGEALELSSRKTSEPGTCGAADPRKGEAMVPLLDASSASEAAEPSARKEVKLGSGEAAESSAGEAID